MKRVLAIALVIAVLVPALSAMGARRKEVCDLCGAPAAQWVEADFTPHGSNIFAKVGGLGQSPITADKITWHICPNCFNTMMERIRALRR